MTHIVSLNGLEGSEAKKKDLTRLLQEQPNAVYFDDPSIFTGAWSGWADQMKIGQSLICTNYPRGSWFARVTRTTDGYKVE